ncbi:MAG TPA: CDP-diacylglycerol--glycerol-3-phosphate 3-phosphatidyltransferase [Gemmataceae bacterium]|jgi:CDP-diacylglycerol--glycerol-3-phosphate 3-phosphatidyltransferase
MATVSPPPARPPIFNLPNQLTASRFVLALVLFALIAAHSWLACLIVFVVAAFTDWLDGYLARKQGLTSTLGRNLDPLVDKVLTCGAYIFLMPVEGAGLEPWMVTVVVARELVITSLRSFLENQGVRFGAEWVGKIKMVLQCAALIAIFIVLQVTSDSPYALLLGWVKDALIYAMLASTILSGLQYLWRSALLLKSDS